MLTHARAHKRTRASPLTEFNTHRAHMNATLLHRVAFQAEQRDILARMNFNLWHNIAHNGALLENVFVMFVCILNRIPVFVVGKPGNSKSLAIQLLDSSLRSDSSQDPLLR